VPGAQDNAEKNKGLSKEKKGFQGGLKLCEGVALCHSFPFPELDSGQWKLGI